MFWKHAWAHAHGGPPACGPRPWKRRRHHDDDAHQAHSRGGWSRGPFGVRRPLRFMARQLDLDEEQVAQMAAILDDLKTQRAQARVDRRKAIGVFADAFLGESFDEEKVAQASKARAASEAEVEQAVAQALARTFEVLDPEQRKRLSYLLRSDGITI